MPSIDGAILRPELSYLPLHACLMPAAVERKVTPEGFTPDDAPCANTVL